MNNYVSFNVKYKDIKLFTDKIKNKTEKDLGLDFDKLNVLATFNTYLLSAINTMEREELKEFKINYPLDMAFKTIEVLYDVVNHNDDLILSVVMERVMCSFFNNELI